MLDVVHSCFNDIRIVRTAILPQEELKNVDRHICAFFDFLCEVFPDNPAVEYLPQLAVNHSICIFDGILFHVIAHPQKPPLQVKSKVIRKGNVNMKLYFLRHIGIVRNDQTV